METETLPGLEGIKAPETTPEPPAYLLGQPVRFTRHLRRKQRHDDVPGRGWVSVKFWATEGWPGQPEPAPRDGLLIGVRWLANGENLYLGYDEGIEFRPTERFEAFVVAHHLRRNPVLVLPEHLTLL